MRSFKAKRGDKRGDKKKTDLFPREIRKKFCRFCKDRVTEVDYKDIGKLQRLITDNGKILSRRMSGSCAKHQRKVAEGIKRARFLALLPYVRG